MNLYIIFAALFSGLGILLMFLGTSEGRKQALANTEKNLVKTFNELDSNARAEFISNAKLNKAEIIVQINNQTVSSASEIIGEVRGKFGIIEKDLSIKGQQINTLNKNITAPQIAEKQKSLKLEGFLKLIPQTNDNGASFQSIGDYLENTRFDSKTHLAFLIKLMELSIDYPIAFHPDGKLRYFFLKTIFRDFPDKVFNDSALYDEYTQRRFTTIIYSGHNSEIIKKGIKMNVTNLYNNGNFISQGYYKDLNSFFQNIDNSQELNDFTYQLVKSREEKFHIYKEHYLIFLKSISNKKYYWGKSLKDEFGKQLTTEEKDLLKNII